MHKDFLKIFILKLVLTTSDTLWDNDKLFQLQYYEICRLLDPRKWKRKIPLTRGIEDRITDCIFQ